MYERPDNQLKQMTKASDEADMACNKYYSAQSHPTLPARILEPNEKMGF